MAQEVHATARVLAFAEKHDIDLATVPARADGQVDLMDVVRAARKRNTEIRDAQVRAATAPTVVSASSVSRPGYELNPLVNAVLRRSSGPVTASSGLPTRHLFAAGDLPSFTASGIAPSELTKVPWQAGHAMAAATTLAEAYRIHEDLATSGDPEGVAAFEYSQHPGNQMYADRVKQWQASSLSEDDLYAQSGFAQVEANYAAQRELRGTAEGS